MAHYYEKKQPSKMRLHEITVVLRSALFTFRMASGVFSARKIDAGTKLLVDSCIIEDKWTVLDLGCGYGAIGIVLKKLYPDCDVFMLDINERAIALAEYNASLNNVNPHILSGNLYEPIGCMQFDTIIVNPPYVAGRKLIFGLIEDAKRHLNKNGLLQIVARHQKGGKTIAKKMEDVFGNLSDHARGGGYHVYISKRVWK